MDNQEQKQGYETITINGQQIEMFNGMPVDAEGMVHIPVDYFKNALTKIHNALYNEGNHPRVTLAKLSLQNLKEHVIPKGMGDEIK